MPPVRHPYNPKRFSVYVIGLNRAVLRVPRFVRENPQHNPTKPCVYVGMTAHTPEGRFLCHKRGIKACKLVRDFGEYLKWTPLSRPFFARNKLRCDGVFGLNVVAAVEAATLPIATPSLRFLPSRIFVLEGRGGVQGARFLRGEANP